MDEGRISLAKLNLIIICVHLGYPHFGNLLNKTDRPMVYSCSWPVYQEENGIMVMSRLQRTL